MEEGGSFSEHCRQMLQLACLSQWCFREGVLPMLCVPPGGGARRAPEWRRTAVAVGGEGEGVDDVTGVQAVQALALPRSHSIATPSCMEVSKFQGRNCSDPHT